MKPGDTAVEIGPGRGALTQSLLEAAGGLHAIEIDRDLAAQLRTQYADRPKFVLHEADALTIDWRALANSCGARLRLIGNLPYNISTPLLFRLLEQHVAIADMHFMLQKEVVDRITAQPATKQYGRLTVMVAAAAEAEALFDVGPGAFQPHPKVWSAVVRLRPSRAPRFDIGAAGVLRLLVATAFSQRRKTLRNGLKSLLSAQEIESCGIDPQLRPETLTPAQFGLLAAQYSRLYSKRYVAL